MTELRNGRKANVITLDEMASHSCSCRPVYEQIDIHMYGATKIVYEDGYFHVTTEVGRTQSYNARYVRSVVWEDEK